MRKAAAAEGVDVEQRPAGLINFTQRFFPGYRAGALHHYLANEVEDALRDRHWLMVSVPPQHGKSEIISVNAPPMYLGEHPDHHWVAASYGLDLARKHSRRARNIFRSAEFGAMYGVYLALDSHSQNEWEIAGHRGGFYATGIGGGLTGRPADVVAIDDPVRNRRDADSPVMREAAWDWWTAVVRTRLSPDAVVILVMTRWHYDDLAGRMLAGEDSDRWRVINLPAIAQDNDPMGRAEGEVIWPERFPDTDTANKFYADLKVGMGPRDWAALAQGTPTLDEDAIFNSTWWGWYDPEDLPPERLGAKRWLWTVQFWDTAFKEKSTSDYNACVTLGVTSDRAYVLDVYNKRHEMPDLLDAGEAQYGRWKPTHLAVENKASGPSMAQMMRKKSGKAVELWDPRDGGDKVARAHVITPQLAAGKVLLPRSAPWVDDFLAQLGMFPAGPHDDMVDAFVGGMHIVKDLWDGVRASGVISTYVSDRSAPVIDERYIDSDTGRAPSPDIVRRRE